MANPHNFHDTRFPLDIAFGSSGGPQRNTEIIALGSGHEQRNQRWKNSRRRYEAGYGVKSLDNLHRVVAFFEARRGPLYGFRFRDPADHKSCLPSQIPSALDQQIGLGDGQETRFQLVKVYGASGQDYRRPISHPVQDSVLLAMDGVSQVPDVQFSVDASTGLVEFVAPPRDGAVITAGYEFDVPVRFDSDQLVINLEAFSAGEVPSIPLVEVRP